jgi:hypothetical protein
MKQAYAMCKIETGAHTGRVVPYYLAAPLNSRIDYNQKVFRLLGIGHIYSIGGERVTGGPALYFYALKRNRPQWAR